MNSLIKGQANDNPIHRRIYVSAGPNVSSLVVLNLFLGNLKNISAFYIICRQLKYFFVEEKAQFNHVSLSRLKAYLTEGNVTPGIWNISDGHLRLWEHYPVSISQEKLH